MMPRVGRFEAVVAGVRPVMATAAYLALRASGTVRVLGRPVLLLAALLAIFAVSRTPWEAEPADC